MVELGAASLHTNMIAEEPQKHKNRSIHELKMFPSPWECPVRLPLTYAQNACISQSTFHALAHSILKTLIMGNR